MGWHETIRKMQPFHWPAFTEAPAQVRRASLAHAEFPAIEAVLESRRGVCRAPLVGGLLGGALTGCGGSGDAGTSGEVNKEPPATLQAWQPTGSLVTRRSNPTATLLRDGGVLVTGGNSSNGNGPVPQSSAEMYGPVHGTWSATGNMTVARGRHTATLLSDGKVLVAGGLNGSSGFYQRSSELYDPASGTWSASGSLNMARSNYAATLLSDGTVLAARGTASDGAYLSSAELYDPAKGIWVVTGALNTGRAYTTITPLGGRILVAGGYRGNNFYLSSAELYDPLTRTWSATGNLTTGRGYTTATQLTNGKVLVAGGYNGSTGQQFSAELYDPASGAWAITGSLGQARSDHTATLLANGTVPVAGGYDIGFLSSGELYRP